MKQKTIQFDKNSTLCTRRDFLKQGTVGVVGSALFPLLAGCAQSRKSNILWIISEDTSPDLGCYGNSLVKTPNLDQFAREGTLFTQAFATSPVCSPSRSALMTGMYQTSINAHQHRTLNKSVLLPPVKILTDFFREAGYFTANVTNPAPNIRGTGKTDWNFISPSPPFDGTDWSERETGQPFFAQINLRLTHRPFERDPEHPINPLQVHLPPVYPDHPIVRKDWADYLESLQVLDRQVGQILKRLEAEDLSENTVVFYFGDHGRPHVWAKQWLYESGIRVPLIIRWPGRLKPGSSENSLVSLIDLGPTAMSMAGIPVPSYMEGQPFLKKNGRGVNHRNHIIAARDRCDETDDRIRCLRTERYKYIRNFFPEKPYTQFNAYKKNQYPAVSLLEVLHEQGKLTSEQARFMAPVKPEEELYDLGNDPFELQNLASNPEYSSEILKMRETLDTWIKETGDKGELPEAQEEKEYWDQQMSRQFKKWMEAKGLTEESTHLQHLEYWKKRLFNE